MVDSAVNQTISVLTLVNPKGFFLVCKLCPDWNCPIQLTSPPALSNINIAYTAYLKMSTRKGRKGQKNIPYLHDEVKTKRTVILTPTAWGKLKSRAIKLGVSISELIEEWARDTTG